MNIPYFQTNPYMKVMCLVVYKEGYKKNHWEKVLGPPNFELQFIVEGLAIQPLDSIKGLMRVRYNSTQSFKNGCLLYVGWIDTFAQAITNPIWLRWSSALWACRHVWFVVARQNVMTWLHEVMLYWVETTCWGPPDNFLCFRSRASTLTLSDQ